MKFRMIRCTRTIFFLLIQLVYNDHHIPISDRDTNTLTHTRARDAWIWGKNVNSAACLTVMFCFSEFFFWSKNVHVSLSRRYFVMCWQKTTLHIFFCYIIKQLRFQLQARMNFIMLICTYFLFQMRTPCVFPSSWSRMWFEGNIFSWFIWDA